MLRFPVRVGMMTMALGGIVAACGSSDDAVDPGGAGGAYPGGFTAAGGVLQSSGGSLVGGAGGVSSTGGTVGSGGIPFGSGGADPSGGSTSSSGGAADTGGAAGSGGLLDGGPDADVPDAAAGAPGTGGTGQPDAAAPLPYCGNGIVDGDDKCDAKATDTKTCDADCTLPVCGDKHVNVAAGEFCDDGAKANGDGCDSACQLENTCPLPEAIPLTASATAGVVKGSALGDTLDSTNYVKPALCDGAARGAGSDALYSFTLTRPRNVTVALSSSFDAILRSYTTACVPGAGLNEASGDACANATAAKGAEAMSFPRLAAGTYYVVVDGATAADKGTFSLDVSAECDGIDDLRVVELGIGTVDYAVIRNMSDCPTSLAGAKLKFDDPSEADVTTSLPNVTLAPGEQLRIQEGLGSSVPGAVDAGALIPFRYTRGGTVLLCKSDCAKAADVVDVVQFADGEVSTVEPPPPPPAGLTFSLPLSGITAANENARSFVRVANTGKNAKFTGNDFCTGEPNAPFGIRLEEAFLGEPDFVTVKNHADCAVSLAAFDVRFQTGGVATAVEAPLDGRFLASGKTAYLSEPTGGLAGELKTPSALANAGGLSGTVRLCRGLCTTVGTTIDTLAWAGVLAAGGTPTAFPALPSPVSFAPSGLSGITDANQGTLSYLRNSVTSGDPHYFAGDWKTAPKSR